MDLGCRSMIVQASAMVLDGNAIACDAIGCEKKNDFDGELPDDDTRVRYHVLGRQIVETGTDEKHHRPAHI